MEKVQDCAVWTPPNPPWLHIQNTHLISKADVMATLLSAHVIDVDPLERTVALVATTWLTYKGAQFYQRGVFE